jgi:hypothetical protein
MKFLKTLLLSGAVLLAAAQAAEARTYALLVGVANYDAPGIHDLLGPRNDVTMIWRALKARGVKPEDVTVLTDNLPQAPEFPEAMGLPVRANILGAFDALAAEAQKGDTVLFYYSGHGSVQPVNPDVAQEEPEADGKDQVILPADVGSYDIITHTIKNAIVDNELADKFTAIRAKGAFVWAVVDACHSGTVTRGEDVTRSVDPGILNVPEVVAPSETRGGERDGAIKLKPGAGGITGFYAVESYDEAIERPFTGYDPHMVGEGDKQRMGVFTYHLHRALMRDTAASYRDLAQEIVADLNTDSSGGKVPPPVFDGDLDEPVPGSDAARIPSSVTSLLADDRLSIPAGILHGFDVGARLALYSPGKPDKPVAHADVTEATAVTSVATGLTWDDESAKTDQGALAAVVESPAITFRFVVAPPPAGDFADDNERGVVAHAIDTLFQDGPKKLGIELGTPGNPDADLILRVKNGRLWIVRPDLPWVETAGAYNETPSLALDRYPEGFETDLKNAVWSLARAAKLLRVASALDRQSTGEEDGSSSDITMKATMLRTPGQDAKSGCPKEPPPTALASPVEPLLPLATGNCDFIEIDVTNESDQDYYMAGFYVDSLGGIAAIPASATQNGCVRTLISDGKKSLRFRFWINTWDVKKKKPTSVGAENFVVLAIPKSENRQPPKLCSLTQPTLAAMQQTRDVEMPTTRGEKSKLADLLGDVEGSATRGVSAATEEDSGPPMTGRLFVFDVKP